MAKKLNTIQQRNYNNLLAAVESNDRTTAKEVFERFFKGKEIEEVVIDKLKEKHDIAYLTEESVEPKKAVVSPKKVNTVAQKKEKNNILTKLEPAKTAEEKSRANLNMTQLSMSRFSALRAVLNKKDLKGENGNYPKRGGSDKQFSEMLDQMYQLLDSEQ